MALGRQDPRKAQHVTSNHRGTWHSVRNSAGFTFIEIVVVMAIIGILAGALVLHSIGADKDRNLETEAERLAALIELARVEALTRNESWGLFVDRTRYEFKVYDESNGTWRAAGKSTFRMRTAPPDVAFSLQVEGLSQLDDSPDQFDSELEPSKSDDDNNTDLPQVLILASGEQTPFLIGVGAGPRASWSVESDGIARTRASPAARSDDRT